MWVGHCLCMRVRLAVAVFSFIGFLVFLIVVLLYHPASSLLPNLPSPSRKVSVVLFPHNSTHLLHTCSEVVEVLSREHLEAELLVVLSSGEALPSLKPLQRKGLHLERVKPHSEFSRTLQEAFNLAHFSIVVVLGDVRVSVGEVLPKLVGPVVAGHSDMTLSQDNTWWLLGLLSYPLTFSTAAGGNASVFCLPKAVWMKGCHGVSPYAASISLELLAKCNLRRLSTVPLNLSDEDTSPTQVLRQIFSLYWELHPFLCLSCLLAAMVLCVLWRLAHTPPLSITQTV